MASKQLGKLRQWGREVIATKEKTVLTEEFKELEQDVDLRRAGVERLHSACSEYHGYLQKKKEYASVEEGVKMLPVDAMGAVMMSHGVEFGDDSAFGQCLLKLGRAHCKVATLQETYALTFRDTYLARLESTLDEMSDYATQRKKLDSRRLAYDAAMTRSSKAKKEKEVKEAEDELSKAKLRYEETSTDVQARMHAIQEKEIEQLRDLTEFLATETQFVEQYLSVLRDTQEEWLNESAILQSELPRRKASPHAFAFGRSTPSISSTSKTSASARPSSDSTGGTTPPEERADEDEYGFGTKRRQSPSNTPRPSSRGSIASTGTAHTSRRRRDSAGAADSDGGGTGNISKRISVAGWASSAVSSLGRSKKEVKKDKTTGKLRDKEAGRAFANLENDEDDSSDDMDADPGAPRDEGLSRSFGSSSLSKVLNRTPSASLRPRSNPMDSSSSSSFNSLSGSMLSTLPKLARALHDFAGGSDELSFRSADEITVISEVKGGWSMGELNGRRGLFPTNYTEEVVAQPRTMTDIAKRAQNDTMSEDDVSIVSTDGQRIGLYDEPFGDHHLAKSPIVAEHDHDAPTDDEDEMQSLFAPRPMSSMPDVAPTITPEGLEVGNVAGHGVRNVRPPPPPPLPQRKPTERKPPPPPPPARRSTISASAAPLHVTNSGGPYVSAPSSTSHLPGGNFPPPPAAPRRATSRARSSNSLSVPSTGSTSPFDN